MTAHRTILTAWPVYVGIFFLLLGNGLQGTLVAVRGALIGFDNTLMGFILSCYFIGYILGCVLAPKLINGVGHIRVYAAFASLASTVALFYTVSDSWVVWAFLRIVVGFCFAAIFIVSESWLGAAANKDNRGRVLSAYMICVFCALAFGQFFLNLADPKSFELFVLVSALISFGLFPMALSKRPQPKYSAPDPLPIKKIFNLSPLGLVGCFTAGLTSTTFLTLLPVYTVNLGYSNFQISTFIAACIITGMCSQFIVGWLSDFFDRRKVLTALLGCIVLVSFMAWILAFYDYTAAATVLTCLLCGLMLNKYSVSTAQVNDRLKESQIVGVAAALVMINGAGALIGPFVVGGLMDMLGNLSFLIVPGFIALIVFIFAIYRLCVSDPVGVENQGDYVPTANRISYVATSLAGKVAKHDDDRDD